MLRVVRVEALPEAERQCPSARYFMDYRNADGSLAEMCGNGVRVFARYLVDMGWESAPEFEVGTRGGCVRMRLHANGEFSVHLPGPVTPMAESFRVTVGTTSWPGVGVTLPNPHVVVKVDDLGMLGNLPETALVSPTPAAGINVEFVQRIGPSHVAMRVIERGIGETQSCGTGACAAAWVSNLEDPGGVWDVDVPGGRLHVEIHDDGTLSLTGPAEVVAEGHVTLP